MSAKKIIIANWKMNPATLNEAKRVFEVVKIATARFSKIDVIICPPFLYLSELKKSYKGRRISFGGQNCFWERDGAFTGEISSYMLSNIGASHVILGHSERRAFGEDDFDINKKILISLKAGLKVCLCVGENERDEDGEYMFFLKSQISNCLENVEKSFLKNILISYEPIWAVGKNAKRVITSSELQETSIFIKKVLCGMYDRVAVDDVKVLYGGSVGILNASDLVKQSFIDGLLVGRESLKTDDFVKILEEVNKI